MTVLEPLCRVNSLTDHQKRVLWRRHYEEHTRAFEAWVAADYQPVRPAMPGFPEVCRGLACCAKTRAGTPCKLISIFLNGRCKLHGGLSTGPKTRKGKASSACNGRAPKGRPAGNRKPFPVFPKIPKSRTW